MGIGSRVRDANRFGDTAARFVSTEDHHSLDRFFETGRPGHRILEQRNGALARRSAGGVMPAYPKEQRVSAGSSRRFGAAAT